jgi:hypothetical protein
MKPIHIILLSIVFILLMLGLSLGFGWFDVYKIKTVGKAKQNAERQVFEQTQSFVEGKRQELVKYHHEWIKADSSTKKAIEATVRISFANFDANKIQEPELYQWLKQIMLN